MRAVYNHPLQDTKTLSIQKFVNRNLMIVLSRPEDRGREIGMLHGIGEMLGFQTEPASLLVDGTVLTVDPLEEIA